jgi:predicted amidohydrolase
MWFCQTLQALLHENRLVLTAQGATITNADFFAPLYCPMRTSIQVAMGQMLVKAGQPQQNLERAVTMIAAAAKAGADLIVLPECLDIGWTDGRAKDLAQPIPGSHSQQLAKAARDHHIHVAAGLVERFGNQLFNSAVLFDDSGGLLLLHRKINELGIAMGLYSIGDRLGVAHCKLGVIGLDICADNVPNSLAIGHVLARMGAQIIVAPSAWAVPPEHDQDQEPYGALWLGAYQHLSRIYDLPVVGVSGVGWLEDGAWKGWKVIGCSLAVGADAQIIAQAPYGTNAEDLRVVKVTLRPPSVLGTGLTDSLSQRDYNGV